MRKFTRFCLVLFIASCFQSIAYSYYSPVQSTYEYTETTNLEMIKDIKLRSYIKSYRKYFKLKNIKMSKYYLTRITFSMKALSNFEREKLAQSFYEILVTSKTSIAWGYNMFYLLIKMYPMYVHYSMKTRLKSGIKQALKHPKTENVINGNFKWMYLFIAGNYLAPVRFRTLY